MADWAKQELVNQVKAWQKTSDSHKEAWYRFVEEKTGESKYDPNRHDEALLAEFTQMADAGQIELQEATGFGSSGKKKGGKGGGDWGGGGFDWGGGFGGGGGETSATKQELVNQVKSWQRQSPSHKEAWYRFVKDKTGETNFDPNRHEEATLFEFAQMAEAGMIELKDPTGFGSSGKKGKGGDWGGGGDDWGGMQQMMMQMMMAMMSGKGDKGGKGGKRASPY